MRVHTQRSFSFQVQIGGLKDAETRRDKYWYLPFIKKYLTYLFTYNSSASNLVLNCDGVMNSSSIRYEVQAQQQESHEDDRSGGFWSYILPSKTSVLPPPPPQPTRVHDWQHLADTSVTEVVVQSKNKGLDVFMSPKLLEMQEFVAEGWSRQFNGRSDPPDEWRGADGIESLEWTPHFGRGQSEDEDKVFYLDNEQVEIQGPLQITHLPDRIRMFCCDSQHRPEAGIRDDSAVKQTGLIKQNFKMQAPSIANKFMV